MSGNGKNSSNSIMRSLLPTLKGGSSQSKNTVQSLNYSEEIDSAIIQIVTPVPPMANMSVNVLATPVLLTPDAFINSPNNTRKIEPMQSNKSNDILQSLIASGHMNNAGNVAVSSSVNTLANSLNVSNSNNLLSSRTSSLTHVTNTNVGGGASAAESLPNMLTEFTNLQNTALINNLNSLSINKSSGNESIQKKKLKKKEKKSKPTSNASQHHRSRNDSSSSSSSCSSCSSTCSSQSSSSSSSSSSTSSAASSIMDSADKEIAALSSSSNNKMTLIASGQAVNASNSSLNKIAAHHLIMDNVILNGNELKPG